METVTYNTYGFAHMSKDAKKYGDLDDVSAFPFNIFFRKVETVGSEAILTLRTNSLLSLRIQR
jgi:hypothetical protein